MFTSKHTTQGSYLRWGDDEDLEEQHQKKGPTFNSFTINELCPGSRWNNAQEDEEAEEQTDHSTAYTQSHGWGTIHDINLVLNVSCSLHKDQDYFAHIY